MLKRTTDLSSSKYKPIILETEKKMNPKKNNTKKKFENLPKKKEKKNVLCRRALRKVKMECQMATPPHGNFLLAISPVFAQMSVFMKQYEILQLYLTCKAFRQGTLNIIIQHLIYSTFNFGYHYFAQHHPSVKKDQYNRICKLSSLYLYKKYGLPMAITHLDITFEDCLFNDYKENVIDMSENLQSYVNPRSMFTDFMSFQKLHTLSVRNLDGHNSKYLPPSLTDLTILSVVNFKDFVFPSELVCLTLEERDCKIISPRQLPQKLKTFVSDMYYYDQLTLLGMDNDNIFPESIQTLELFSQEMLENDSGKQILIPGNVTTLGGMYYDCNYFKFAKPDKIVMLHCNLSFTEIFISEIFTSLFPNLQTLCLRDLAAKTKLDTYNFFPLIHLRKLSLVGTAFRTTAIHLSTSVIPPNLEYLDFEPIHADRVNLQHHTCLRFFVVHGDKPYVYNRSALPTSLEALYLIQTYPDASWISSWMTSTIQTFNRDGILLIRSLICVRDEKITFSKKNDTMINVLPFELVYSKLPFDYPKSFLDSQHEHQDGTKSVVLVEEWFIQNIVKMYVLNQGSKFCAALKKFMFCRA